MQRVSEVLRDEALESRLSADARPGDPEALEPPDEPHPSIAEPDEGLPLGWEGVEVVE